MSSETIMLPGYRADGFQNEVTGIGTSRDKRTYAQALPGCNLSDPELETLFNEVDVAARMVEVIPQECFREGFDLKLGDKKDEGLVKAVNARLQELSAVQRFVEADIWGRNFGGCVLVMGTEDIEAAARPLNTDVGLRSLQWVMPLDRRYVYPKTFYTGGAKAGEPDVYTITMPSGHGYERRAPVFDVHETRMIIFRGQLTSLPHRQMLNYWDYSVLRRPYNVIRSFEQVFAGAELLVTDGRQGVYKVKNLVSLLGSKGREALVERIGAIDLFRSVARAIVVDADGESFEQIQTTFSGLPEILQMFILRLAASVHMPSTILMGQSPAGMSATGESDFRWWYDSIRARQRSYVEPRLRRLVEIICAAKDGPTGGKQPDSIVFDWRSLWTPTAAEASTIRKTDAETAAIYVGAEVVAPDEVAEGPGMPDLYAIDHDVRQLAIDARNAAAKSDDEGTGQTDDLLTPTDYAAVVSVNEARAAKGLEPEEDDAIGTLKVAELRALQDKAALETQTDLDDSAPEPDPNAPPQLGPDGKPLDPAAAAPPFAKATPSAGPAGKTQPAFPPRG